MTAPRPSHTREKSMLRPPRAPRTARPNRVSAAGEASSYRQAGSRLQRGQDSPAVDPRQHDGPIGAATRSTTKAGVATGLPRPGQATELNSSTIRHARRGRTAQFSLGSHLLFTPGDEVGGADGCAARVLASAPARVTTGPSRSGPVVTGVCTASLGVPRTVRSLAVGAWRRDEWRRRAGDQPPRTSSLCSWRPTRRRRPATCRLLRSSGSASGGGLRAPGDRVRTWCAARSRRCMSPSSRSGEQARLGKCLLAVMDVGAGGPTSESPTSATPPGATLKARRGPHPRRTHSFCSPPMRHENRTCGCVSSQSEHRLAAISGSDGVGPYRGDSPSPSRSTRGVAGVLGRCGDIASRFTKPHRLRPQRC